MLSHPTPDRLDLVANPEDPGPQPARTRQVDRLDSNGAVIGVTLITETDWDTWIEHYDLSGKLVGSSSTRTDGSSEESTWTPLVNDLGATIGERHQSRSRLLQSSDSGETVVVTSEWTSDTDINGQLITSQYSNSDGSWERTVRGPAPQVTIDSPAPLSHVLDTQGVSAGVGPYSRTEVYDVNGALVQLRAAYADGSSETYDLIAVHAEDESITGYTGIWSWTDANGTTSRWSEQQDPNLQALDWGEEALNPAVLMAMGGMERGLVVAAEADNPDPSTGLSSSTHSLRLNTAQHAAVTKATLQGDGNFNLRGNQLANVLIGNDGNNRIAGGRGMDRLTGRGGTDHFVLRAHRSSTDTITDFNPREDHLLLRGAEFSDLFRRDGQLRQGVLGDRLRFEAKQEALVWTPEANGDIGGNPPVTLAILQGLQRQDFSADLLIAA